jgi:hypothetical protein
MTFEPHPYAPCTTGASVSCPCSAMPVLLELQDAARATPAIDGALELELGSGTGRVPRG